VSQKPENKHVRIGGYVVALLDVLNQREAIRALSKMPANEDERRGFIQKLKASIGVGNGVREMVLRFLQNYLNAKPSAEIQLLTAEQRKIYDRNRQHRVGTYLFSDTITVHSSLISDSGSPTVRGVYAALASAASGIMNCMATRVPIRGAIEAGVGVPCDKGEIYGPAFLAAYELEQTVVKWPRVVVGDELLEFLRQVAGVRTNAPDAILQRTMADVCLSLIARDEDGMWIVDYLGPGMRRLLPGPEFNSPVAAGLIFATSEHQRFVRTGDTKHAERYAAVIRYFQSRIAIWQ